MEKLQTIWNQIRVKKKTECSGAGLTWASWAFEVAGWDPCAFKASVVWILHRPGLLSDSFGGLGFNSQHANSGSRSSVTAVQGDRRPLWPPWALHPRGAQTCKQAKTKGQRKNPKTKIIQMKNNSRISNQMNVPEVHQKRTNNPTPRCLLTQPLNVARVFSLHKTFYNLSFSSSRGIYLICFSARGSRSLWEWPKTTLLRLA